MTRSFQRGALFEGAYELISQLGEGAMGSVWLAKDLSRGIDVAVKVMLAAFRENPERRAAFEREATLSARMLSPHIVRVLSHGVTTGGAPYIVYEALSGQSLDVRLEREVTLDIDETELIVVHVARALVRAHGMGVVHKDIKPGNVFLTKDDRGQMLAKVLDFGIAELAAPPGAAKLREISGTIGYMPLEVIMGAPPDGRADLFALAAMAYECLAGVIPYDSSSGGIAAIVDALKRPPASLATVYPDEAAAPLDAWMRRALAPDAGLRFQTPRDLALSFHDATKEAKDALGLLRPRGANQPDREVPANRVDTVSKTPTRLVAPAPLRPKKMSFVFEDEPTPPPPRVPKETAGLVANEVGPRGKSDKRRE